MCIRDSVGLERSEIALQLFRRLFILLYEHIFQRGHLAHDGMVVEDFVAKQTLLEFSQLGRRLRRLGANLARGRLRVEPFLMTLLERYTLSRMGGRLA